MRRLLLLLGCAVLLLAQAGCQSPQEKAVNVVIEGGGRFPKPLVGRWKADSGGWEFVFEPDGTISYAVIDRGKIKAMPSKGFATVPLKNEGEGTYEFGQWTVQYAPKTRELAVEVVVDHFHLDMRTFGLKGNLRDWFVGPVSEDSQTWKAEWFSFPKYIALNPDPHELPVDPNENPQGVLVFTKQQETK